MEEVVEEKSLVVHSLFNSRGRERHEVVRRRKRSNGDCKIVLSCNGWDMDAMGGNNDDNNNIEESPGGN